MPVNHQQYAITLTVLFIGYIILDPRLRTDLNRSLGRAQLVCYLLFLIITRLTRHSGQRCLGSRMPTLVAKLSSRPKAIAEAKIAATSCFPQAVVAVRVHDEQGCFSL